MDNVQIIRIQILAVIGSVLLIFFILELIRRKRLREEFAILWLAMGAVFLALSVFRGLLDKFSYLIGIGYPPAALFLILILGLMLILIHFSTAISELKDTQKKLVQEIGLLKAGPPGGPLGPVPPAHGASGGPLGPVPPAALWSLSPPPLARRARRASGGPKAG
jgi:hypothetical protein